MSERFERLEGVIRMIFLSVDYSSMILGEGVSKCWRKNLVS